MSVMHTVLSNCCIHPLNDNQLEVHYNVWDNQCSLKTHTELTRRVLVYLVFQYHAATVVSNSQNN